MDRQKQKEAAARAALQFIEPGMIVGVGTGSTVNAFIEALGEANIDVEAYVSSSVATETRLRARGLPVLELNQTGDLPIYVDGADEIDAYFRMIKGGGAALTREKIVASAARKFVCIADGSKDKKMLGAFPLPVEVLPFARSFVARQLVKLGGDPKWREGVVTDNGNQVLDVTGLDFGDPLKLEQEINMIPGVLDNGVFAKRHADVLLLGTENGVEKRELA